jgi:alkylation response protein AidB-like acyl-CoA dehydrogenase
MSSLTGRDFRREVQDFLADNLPEDWDGVDVLDEDARRTFLDRWRATLHERRFLAPDWPEEYGGGGMTALEQVILAEEFARARVPSSVDNDPFGINLLGNTLLTWGTEEQKRYLLPRIIDGTDAWCQGYSEPQAGSDLGNVQLDARLDGDDWTLNGQKTWTSRAQTANHIFVLARTDRDAPKHRGISFLLVDMRQPGVEVRPIKMLNGGSEFCEVFFTDARCPADAVVGGVHNGWAVAMSLLGFERGKSAATMPVRFRHELDALLALARERGLTSAASIRQRLAACHIDLEIMRMTGLRSLERFLGGHRPGPEAGITKLYWSEYHRRVTALAIDVLGAEAMAPTGDVQATLLPVDGSSVPSNPAAWVDTFLFSCADTIYGGSSQVQRNILGEMLLGLPKEPPTPTDDRSKRAGQ